jgi:hypothetical protein
MLNGKLCGVQRHLQQEEAAPRHDCTGNYTAQLTTSFTSTSPIVATHFLGLYSTLKKQGIRSVLYGIFEVVYLLNGELSYWHGTPVSCASNLPGFLILRVYSAL